MNRLTEVRHTPSVSHMLATGTMTTADAARRIGRSPRTIHRAVRAGKLLPLFQVPGKTGAFIFTAGEVERFAAQMEKAAS